MIARLLEKHEEKLETLEEENVERQKIKVVHRGPRIIEEGYTDYVGVTDIYSCAGVLVYDSVGEKVMAAHVTSEDETRRKLQKGLERFQSKAETAVPVAHVIDGNSDNEETVETTIDVFRNYQGIQTGVIRYQAEEKTEGDICISLEDGKVFDFRPSEETIREYQRESPI